MGFSPVSFTFLAVLVTFDNLPQYQPATTPKALTQFLNAQIVPRIKYCSDSKSDTVFNVSQVQIPSSGVWQGNPWSIDTCQYNDFRGWSVAVTNRLEASNTEDLTKYDSLVLIFPKQWPDHKNCSFVGVGDVGMWDPHAFVWLSASNWNNPGVYLHELGHNHFLKHSWYTKEYDDASSAMGYANPVCYSAPESWRLGWTSQEPIILDSCGTATITLPKYEKQIVIIKSASTGPWAFFVQYRKFDALWDQLAPSLRNSILVHKFLYTLDPFASSTPFRMAVLKGSLSSYYDPAYKFNITVVEDSQADIVIVVNMGCVPKMSPPPQPTLHPSTNTDGPDRPINPNQKNKKKKKHPRRKRRKLLGTFF